MNADEGTNGCLDDESECLAGEIPINDREDVPTANGALTHKNVP